MPEKILERRRTVFASSVDRPPGESGPANSKVAALLGRIFSAVTVRRRERRLRLCEMLPLGDKRFVAVVEYGSQKFLLAGTPQTISLLRYLDASSVAGGEPPRAGPDPE
ncbi:MAG: flagellar biosynthetic protein FliO [Acidobacteriia bacterium]|nr:flagellar biosynthetic protein FliO [Terriglobia bacterium]